MNLYLAEYRNGYWKIPNRENKINPYPIVPIGSSTPYINQDAKIIMNSNGDTVIAWSQLADPINYQNYAIFVSEYREGVWKHPKSVDEAINKDLGLSVGVKKDNITGLAIDDNGNTILTFSKKTGEEIDGNH